MHPYLFSVIYRERLAQFERDAERRRQLPKPEPRPLRTRFGSLLSRSRRRTPVVTRTTAEARPCH